MMCCICVCIYLSGQPKIAFSAALQKEGNIGPANFLYPLVYSNVLSNIGGHYSPQTGVFLCCSM